MEKEENKAGEEEHWQGSLEQYSEKKNQILLLHFKKSGHFLLFSLILQPDC